MLFAKYNASLRKEMNQEQFDAYLNALRLFVKKENIEERIGCINNFLASQKLEPMFKMCSDRVLTDFSDSELYHGVKKLHASVVNRYIVYILIARVFACNDKEQKRDLFRCLR